MSWVQMAVVANGNGLMMSLGLRSTTESNELDLCWV